jgi:outer membrane protein TolC
MRKHWLPRVTLALCGLLVPALVTRAELPVVNIGVVVDGPWRGNLEARQRTIDEVTALTQGEFDVRFPDEAYLIGDWTLASAGANLDRLLGDPEVDLVITWGLLASHAVCSYESLSKPVIAPVIIDTDLQGLPYDNGTSGRTNLNYVTFPDNLTDEILIFLDIVSFEHVAILTNAALVDAIPELPERTSRSLAGLGVEFDFVPVGNSADDALSRISEEVDAVFSWPLFQLSPSEFQRLVNGLNERRLATYSSIGGEDLVVGMLASAGDTEFFPRLTRRVALNAQRILLGEDAGSLPVDFTLRQRLVINMKTARAIDVSPRWEVLIEAELLHAEAEEGVRRLSLKDAIEEALLVNLDLVVSQQVLSAGEQDVARARSILWPQIDFSARGSQIDKDRAAASFGSQAERTVSSSISLTQLLYSDGALGNVTVQEYLQKSREHEFDSLRLDITLEAATTYLNVMRARALARVQKNNVQQIRSNLDLARVRRELGVASAGEVLRWENQLATARRSLVQSISSRRAAEIALNRVLHRPLDESFIPEDVGLSTPGFPTDENRFRSYIDTPKKFDVFSRFLVLEGLFWAPELKQLDAGIEAQKRLLKAARRAYWVPELGVQASFERILSRAGAGSEGGDVFGLSLPMADNTNWGVSVAASLPLFTGGSRSAERIQAEFDLERLLFDRAATEERLEQRIRSSLEQVRASFIGIRFAEESAKAARENLALVEDAYARGAASLLDLLDAQTAQLNAEEQAANALYDFLGDWLETHRAANILDLILDFDNQMAFADLIDEHFVTHGFAPRRGQAPPIER